MSEIEKKKLEIRIDGNSEGENFNEKLSLSNFDFSEFQEMISHIYNLVSSINSEKLLVTYNLKAGSLLNEIEAPEEIIEKLNNLFYSIDKKRSINNLTEKQANAIDYFQKMSKKKNREIKITNTANSNIKLNINPYTNYKIEEDILIETELTIYGVVTYMGGKTTPSIHLDTDEYGLVTVYTNERILKQIKTNLIYQEIGILVSAKQNINTYKLQDVRFVRFVEYSTEYDKEYLESLFKKGQETWKDVKDINNWLMEIRS
ncbi:MAG: hypothetical protein AABZ74_02945 [Cyanobacteriota bacterium]